MKRIPLFFLSLATVYGCHSEKIDVKRICLSPTVINEELATNFPHELYVDQHYFYTPAMQNSGNVIGIYDKNTGDEIARTVQIGKGPQEFITPQIQQIFNGRILVCDLNLKQQALFPVEEALSGKYECYMLPKVDILNYTRVLMIDKDDMVFLQPAGKHLFHHLNQDSSTEFGERFMNISEKNSYTLFQGNVAYHFKKKKLVYSNFQFPYISIYDFGRGAFTLSRERIDFDRSDDGKIKYDKTRKGIGGLTLTKDYIVGIQRDYENDPTDESTVGRDFPKLSHTLFLYDFDTNLISIVDLGFPVIRIASIQDNNEIIAAIFRQDKFQVVKYQLPDRD